MSKECFGEYDETLIKCDECDYRVACIYLVRLLAYGGGYDYYCTPSGTNAIKMMNLLAGRGAKILNVTFAMKNFHVFYSVEGKGE
jgi:hypothetical protein